jgi:hypothetical protein
MYSFGIMLPYYHPKTLKNNICKTIIVSGILFGCLNMAIYCKEEHKVLMFESKVLRIYEG